MLTLQEKLDAAKAEGLLKIGRHIKEECEGWADWKKLSEKEQEEVESGYESCYFAGWNAAMKVIEQVYLRLPVTRETDDQEIKR